MAVECQHGNDCSVLVQIDLYRGALNLPRQPMPHFFLSSLLPNITCFVLDAARYAIWLLTKFSPHSFRPVPIVIQPRDELGADPINHWLFSLDFPPEVFKQFDSHRFHAVPKLALTSHRYFVRVVIKVIFPIDRFRLKHLIQVYPSDTQLT